MTKEEAKEFYPILHAFAEGKVIECRTKPDTISAGIPNKWTETNEIWCVNSLEYRIKSEPKYRSFRNAEECLQEMLKHQPFGWIKAKEGGYQNIVSVDNCYADTSVRGILLASKNSYQDNTFFDGTPFGVKMEE